MSSIPASFDVVVVGRGAVGITAALALARTGLRCALVGPAPRIAPPSGEDDIDARVFALSPSSRALLREVGAWEAIPAGRIAPVHDMDVQGGPDLLHFSAYEAGIEALAWIVENRSLMLALDPGLRFAGVTLFESALAGLAHAPEAVTLELEDGRSLRASLVVGADGAKSRVRDLAGLQLQVTPYGQTAVVANFRAALPHLDTARQWFTPEGIVAMLPLPPDAAGRARLSMVWSAPEALAHELLALLPEELALRAARAAPGMGALELLGTPAGFPLALGRLATPVAERVVLVGDAAHTMHPLAGQGMNVGFGDVAGLRDVLAAREPGRDPGAAALLRRHARARKEAVQAMQFGTDGLHRLFHRAPDALVPLRDAGWMLVARSAHLRRAFIRQATR